MEHHHKYDSHCETQIFLHNQYHFNVRHLNYGANIQIFLGINNKISVSNIDVFVLIRECLTTQTTRIQENTTNYHCLEIQQKCLSMSYKLPELPSNPGSIQVYSAFGCKSAYSRATSGMQGQAFYGFRS